MKLLEAVLGGKSKLPGSLLIAGPVLTAPLYHHAWHYSFNKASIVLADEPGGSCGALGAESRTESGA